MKSLLNETYLISGSRTPRTRRVAYAPQDAFLWPTTIRDNIIMDNPYDPTWYSTVLDACALQLDLARIPGGDMAVMSEGGGSVSGGQKQRIVRMFSI